jgi:hypothetical protein
VWREQEEDGEEEVGSLVLDCPRFSGCSTMHNEASAIGAMQHAACSGVRVGFVKRTLRRLQPLYIQGIMREAPTGESQALAQATSHGALPRGQATSSMWHVAYFIHCRPRTAAFILHSTNKGHSKKKVTDPYVYLINFRGTNQPQDIIFLQKKISTFLGVSR